MAQCNMSQKHFSLVQGALLCFRGKPYLTIAQVSDGNFLAILWESNNMENFLRKIKEGCSCEIINKQDQFCIITPNFLSATREEICA